MAIARSSKNIETRLRALEKSLEGEPSTAVFFPLAYYLWEQGKADEAIAVLEEGLSRFSSYLAPRVLLGEIYLAKEQHEKAAAELEKVVEKAPWNLTAQKLLMDCRKQAGDEIGAGQTMVAIAMFDPMNEATQGVLEQVSFEVQSESGVSEDDEAPLEESVEPVPSPSLAELYVSQGHLNKAVEVYQKLLVEDPENEEFRGRLSSLEAQLVQEAEETVPLSEDVEMMTPEEELGEDIEDDLESMLPEESEEDGAVDEVDTMTVNEEEIAAALGEVSSDDLEDIGSILAEVEEPTDEEELSVDIVVDGETADVEVDISEIENGEIPEDLAVDIVIEKDGGSKPEDEEKEPVSETETKSQEDTVSEPMEIEEEDLQGTEVIPVGKLPSEPEDSEPEFVVENGVPEDEELEEASLKIEDESETVDMQVAEEHIPEPESERDQISAVDEVQQTHPEGDLSGGALEFFEAIPGEEMAEPSGEVIQDLGLDFTDEPSPSLHEPASVLREIVEDYVQEGAYQQALDLCRRAEGLGERSAWLDSQIRYLEDKSRAKRVEYLPKRPEGDKKMRPSSPVSSSIVVNTLESWLQTIQRKKAKLTAEGRGDSAGNNK